MVSPTRRLAAIVCMDVAGYARLMGADEEGTLARVQALQREVIDPALAAHRGRLVKTIGDGFLAEFASVVDAVRCTTAIQRDAAARDEAEPEARRIALRIGVNLGDVIAEGGDLHGDGVNVAARLEALAAPGAICLSGAAYEQVRDKVAQDLTFNDAGEQTLKNIARPVRVWHAQLGAAAHGLALAAPTPRDRDQPAVIVMPFDNLSGEADGYFVDGVVEEITAALSRVREFFVIARQSAFAYKGRFVDVREVGRELGVNYIVEGTVRRGGERLRISVQLVDPESRAQLWSDRYEGAATDIFEFQDRIAAQVAGAINPAVRAAEIDFARRKPPGSLRAHDLVLQAYPKIWSQSPEDNEQAIALLQSAIAVEPRYGRAHALLAWCHAQDVVYLWSPEPERHRQAARAAVDAASDLIADDPTALAAVGAAISQCLDDLGRAESYIAGALRLDPNNAWAWARYAWLALFRNEPDRAMQLFERALALNPLDPLEFHLRLGIALAFGIKGDYAAATRLIRAVLNQHPRVTWAYRQLAYIAALDGDLVTARDAMAKLRAANPYVSLALMKASHPARQMPRVFDLMLEGWRRAGMPES
jgi:TolB-like protein/class 3 adenylate cyclase/Tfp pilus assembly protein PilF